MMMTKSMVKSPWAEEKEQFLYHLDLDTRKNKKKTWKITIKNNKQWSILFNKTYL